MRKIFQIVIIVALVAGVALVAQFGSAWASKVDSPAPVADASGNGVGVSKPLGTVETTDDTIATSSGGTFVVGSAATVILGPVSNGATFDFSVSSDYPTPPAGSELLSAAIKLTSSSGDTLGTSATVCFPVAPGGTGVASYWNGSSWVSGGAAANGQSCVSIPGGSANPSYAGLIGS